MDTPGRIPRWTRAEYDRLVERGILHEDERVELIAGQILLKDRYPVVERGWTRTEYDRLVAGGLLPARGAVELMGGALVCAEPQGSRHAAAVDLAADALRVAIGAGWAIRVEKPLALGDESEPEPDVAVVAGTHRDYRDAHPATAALVVEVAESSLDADRAHKGSLYGRAGVPEYWIVNLADRIVEVWRTPAPDAAALLGWRYREREIVGPAGAISPLAVPAARVLIADLLP